MGSRRFRRREVILIALNERLSPIRATRLTKNSSFSGNHEHRLDMTVGLLVLPNTQLSTPINIFCLYFQLLGTLFHSWQDLLHPKPENIHSIGLAQSVTNVTHLSTIILYLHACMMQ